MEKSKEKSDKSRFQKYLPIGTVVLLKDGEKRLMITGFCVRSKKEDQEYDYCGVIYPEGVISATQSFLFNHKQIVKIFHLGLYKDEEEKKFKKMLANREE